MPHNNKRQNNFNKFNNRNRGKSFHRGKKYQPNSFQRSGPKKERPNAEQLTEQDVGITEYISQHPGFSGIIKARFSDFHVNEIDWEGNVAKLTDTNVPADLNEDGEEKAEIKPSVVPEDVWQKIQDLSEKASSDEVVTLEVTGLSKDQRTSVHQAIKRCFEKSITSNTVTRDEKKFLEFRKFNKQTDNDRIVQWPKSRPQFVHFLMYKESLDTMEACYRIADSLRMRVDNFVYAGVKDRRAKTTQWVSVRKVQPVNLINKTKPMRNIKIGNICFKEQPLKLGRLRGNRFRIALRNITADDDTVNKAMESLKDRGFINYYGLQRFGNDKEVPTFLIGAKLMQGNFKEACDLILKLKVSDDPNSDITEAKRIYNQTGDAKKSCEVFNKNRNKCLEYKLLEGLSKNGPNDYVNSLENIPRTTRLLYIHSLQSLIWNQMVSRRIKEFGLKPIVGDLVLLDQSQVDEDVSLEEADGEEKNSVEAEGERQKDTQQVKILSQEDIEKYSINDVVLPLPGFDVKYPENVVKDWYKDSLRTYGLELEMHKQKVKTYTLSGKYRKLCEKVSNLSWYTLHYDDPNCNLIRSDYEELQGEEEPKNVEGGQYKALIIDMCLTSSIYATMVLREILKMDTSSASQTKLNDYHGKGKASEATSSLNEVSKNEQSLLDSPDKFALFKQMVFDDNDDFKRKNEDEVDGGEQKKLKIDEKGAVNKKTVVADVI